MSITKEEFEEYSGLILKIKQINSELSGISDKIAYHTNDVVELIHNLYKKGALDFWGLSYCSDYDDFIERGSLYYEYGYKENTYSKKSRPVFYKGKDLIFESEIPVDFLFMSLEEIEKAILDERKVIEEKERAKKEVAKKRREAKKAEKKTLIEAAKKKLSKEEIKALGIK